MDVMKLFETSDTNIAPLDMARLDAMIDQAAAYPQIRVPANENKGRFRRMIAVAAVLVIALTVSLQLAETTLPTFAPETTTAINTNSDAYDEVSDLIMLETLSDLS